MLHALRLVLIASLIAPFSLLADVTGTILGVVTDPSSALVQGVTIVATNLETNLSKETKSDANGQYRLLALPAGRYKVQAEFSGFQPFTATDIVVAVNDQRRLDIVLRVGATQQEVNVVANAIQVETTNTQIGEVIEDKKIMNLPLNGRGYLDLLGLQPGVAPASSRNEGPGTVSVNGQRENSNGFLVNGGDVAGAGDFEAQIQPNLDAVQEFRLITNTFDAEYGRFSGSIMNTITKSGTNSFHGTLFEFMRNDALDARGFFDNGKGRLQLNQFGYAVGGPAIKDKLFWFTDYQGSRRADGGTSSEVLVPSAAERSGQIDVSRLTGRVTGPYWAETLSKRLGYTVTDGQPYSTVFPGGVIPERAFSPAAKGTMGFIPLPNRGTDTYVSSTEPIRTRDDMLGQRVDFINQLTGNWSGYYYFQDTDENDPFGSSSFLGLASASRSRRQQGTLSNVKVLSPTTVNEFRASYVGIIRRSVPASDAPPLESLGFITGTSTLGLNNAGPDGYMAVPSISLSNFAFGSSGTNNIIQHTYQISDSFSKISGRHTIRMGVDVRYYQLNRRDGGGLLGQFSFRGTETGYDVADYLLGAPTSFTQASLQSIDSRSKYAAAYIQDSIRFTRGLTVNLGLRWETAQPWYDTQDRILTMEPGRQSTQFPNAPMGLLYPGDEGVPRTLSPTRYKNFAPRVGIAWSPSASGGLLGKLFGEPGTTSIRVGSGIFFNAIQDQTLFWIIGSPPFGNYWLASQPVLFEEPYRTRATGESQGQRFPFVYPVPGSPEARNVDFSPFLPMSSTLGYKLDNSLPYGLHFNFNIQRQLSSSMVLSLGYVGTMGRKLLSIVENNPGDAQLCLSLRGDGVMPGTLQCGPFQEDATFTRPDGTLVHGTRTRFGPNFSTGFWEATWASSSYHSLQTSLERRAGDVTFLFGYTWSKALDNGSFFNDRMNPVNHALAKTYSNFDTRHNFVASYVYEVPFHRAFPTAPAALVRGWSFAGITRFATGFPAGIFAVNDRSLLGTSGMDRPDLVGPVNFVKDPRGAEHRWFTGDNFVEQPLGTFGTVSRRPFHGPGLNNWNLSIAKDTTIRESMRFNIRADMFNAFNHAQFNMPNGQFGNVNFGRISSAKAPRIIQLGAKFHW